MKFFSLLLVLLGSLAFAQQNQVLTVLHTNDLHSHFEGSGPDHYFTSKVGDGDPIKGHYARLAFQIKTLRKALEKKGTPVLLVDSGDFFAGSLFQVLAPSVKNSINPELEFFRDLKYDAVTFGNHEFDAGEVGLEIMLQNGIKQNLLSSLILSNLYFRNPSSSLEKIVAGVPSFKIIVLKVGQRTVKVGIIGLMGIDAAKVSSVNRPNVSFYGFNDIESSGNFEQLVLKTQELVNTLRSEKKVDVVIALFHGGNDEDEKLASKVNGISLIVAGHTHQFYKEPKLVHRTLIVQAGSYGEKLGQIDLNLESLGESSPLIVSLGKYTLHVIDDKVPCDTVVLEKIDKYKKLIPKSYSKEYDYGTPITTIRKELTRTSKPNDPMGQLLTSGILAEVNKSTRTPIDLYMTSMGLIRENLKLVNQQPTTYQFSDIFRILSIGFNKADGIQAGSPIVSFYMEQDEFIKLMNFMEVYRFISPNFIAAYSQDITYEVRDWGIPFVNRLKNITLRGKPISEAPKLLHVATNEYVSNFLPIIKNLSYGIVKLHYRNQDGAIVDKPFIENSPPEPILFSNYLRNEGKQLIEYDKQRRF